MTCPGSKKQVEEPRQLSEAELLVIREWYAKKDKELEDARGQSYVAQRNLSTQAKMYHEASSANHKQTKKSSTEQPTNHEQQDTMLEEIRARTLKCPGGKEQRKTKTLEAAGVPNGAMCSLKAMPKGKTHKG